MLLHTTFRLPSPGEGTCPPCSSSPCSPGSATSRSTGRSYTQHTELSAPAWLCRFLLPNLGIQVQEGTQERALSSSQLQSRALAHARRHPPIHTLLQHIEIRSTGRVRCLQSALNTGYQMLPKHGTQQSPACKRDEDTSEGTKLHQA